ncbi:MAG TPA: hypothetical protein PLN31_18485 [Azoarcus taiwanensis]|nr:hypothetical protein [Azoarcus taiwanensis]
MLEALVAITILALAFASTMAFHGNIVASAAENRLLSAAMGLAEAKIEELRATRFDDIASGSDPQTVPTFTLLSAVDVALTRCWTVTDEAALKRVEVAVVRGEEECGPASALVVLVTRIAENDFLLAGRNTRKNKLFDPDGRGEIVDISPDQATPVPGVPALDGGFDAVEYGDGLYAVLDPDTGKALLPDVGEDEEQRFATINGNIFLSGRTCVAGAGSIASRCQVELVTEGNALCRLHYPGSSGEPPSIPGMDGIELFGYLSYSCVVADQWRRSIAVIPADSDEKVCVGHPGLLLDPDDSGDALKSASRFYDGRQEVLDADSVVGVYPHGVKGGLLEGEYRAVIGSVWQDEEGDPDVRDDAIRGLVPGGHHFLVMEKADGKCSVRMKQLEALDALAGTYYADLLARNPDIFYCTSAKDYTGEYCTGYTRVSGFIRNRAVDGAGDPVTVSGQEIDIVSSGSGLSQSCSHFGPFGESGGGFVCGFRHQATTGSSVSGLPLAIFSPSQHLLLDVSGFPLMSYPLDVFWRDFELTGAPTPSE